MTKFTISPKITHKNNKKKTHPPLVIKLYECIYSVEHQSQTADSIPIVFHSIYSFIHLSMLWKSMATVKRLVITVFRDREEENNVYIWIN